MTSSLLVRWLLRLASVIALIVIAALALNRSAKQPEVGGSRSDSSSGGTDAPRRVNLKVESQPTGASLLVNGRLAGATPLTLVGLEKGRYGLRFERNGCKSEIRYIDLSDSDAIIKEKLEALPMTTMNIKIEPKGAEVLLDGEFVGHTPLKDLHVPAGAYELLIRKTNYESYSKRIMIEPGAPAMFAGFELKDKILNMLTGNCKNEPQRLAHCLDLGHYLFLNDKMDEAVNVFAQGLEVMQTPLDFDGQGFGGKDTMSAAEINLEQRLRKEDEIRLLKDIEKYRNWPNKNTIAFKKKMDAAYEVVGRRNINSWSWTDRVARICLKGQNYERAAKIYLDHIAAAPKTPDLPKAYVALLEVYLTQRDIIAARKTFDQFYELYQNDGTALRDCSRRMKIYKDRIPNDQGRQQVLEMAEQALRRSRELPAMKDQ
ncbi:MAG: PEGA domain-containing protein [Planctomycetota bacterium]